MAITRELLTHMARQNKKPLIVTGGEIFSLLFLSSFVIAGIAVWVFFGSQQNQNQHGFLLIWTLIFAGVPLISIVSILRTIKKRADALRLGTRYQAKIVGYAFDYAMRVSGQSARDIVVAFIKDGKRYQRAISTKMFNRTRFPIGATVDIYEYKGEYLIGSEAYDERIPRETELMGNTSRLEQNGVSNPPAKEDIWGTVVCPHCGQEFVVEHDRTNNGYEGIAL